MFTVLTASDDPQVDPKTYGPILSTIAKGESKGNYNAYFGSVNNSEIDFTSMTVAEVLQWQKDFIEQGNPSSAVGKYQIIRPTLNGLVQQLGIEQSALYDAALQDRMAVALLERRGSLQYIQNELTPEQFAANLSQEWAALPKVVGDQPNQSYYAGDGLNKAQISVDEVITAVNQLKKM